MNLVPVFDLNSFPLEIMDAFEDFSYSKPDEWYADFTAWPLVMPAKFKQSISDDDYNAYRMVSDYILEELDEDFDYVLIKTVD